ncbi:hypothetical protein EBB07_02345 [Paenibacillaceae bacterium]|nr:hypothetical protein EBB07_02345 [Paenibacillaceae bacterium]
MSQTMTLQQFLEENGKDRIEAIAGYIGNYIREEAQAVLHNNQERLLKAYNEAGDAAYGTYLNLLFLPIHKQFKKMGFRLDPHLPGNFDISREWGNEEQTEQQRWMWSTVYSSNGTALGTLVTIVYHDHSQFRIPRLPQIIALSEIGKVDVVAALSLRSPEFEEALEFTLEYERYLQSQQVQEAP